MNDINNFDAMKSAWPRPSRSAPGLGRGREAGDDQLPDAEAREGRALLRAHLRSDQGLGVLLRQVQARPLQGHRLRALRRRGDALEGAPRAHGSHRPGRARLPHLVLQGRARAGSATCSTWLRRSSRRSCTSPPRWSRGSTTRRAPRTSTPREGSQRGARRLRGREGGADPRAQGVARAPRAVPGPARPGGLLRRGPPVGRVARRQRREGLRRRAREAAQGAPQELPGRHRRHRGLHRGRRRAAAPGVGAVQDDGAEGHRQRRDDVPRAQGPLRLAVRVRRVLPRRDGRRVRPRPAPAGRSRRRGRRPAGAGQDRQGPEAGPRGQAAEGRLGVPQLRQQARR